MSPPELARRLREEFGIETEMSTLNYVLAMFTIGDVDGNFSAFEKALLSLEEEEKVSMDDRKTNGFKKDVGAEMPEIRIPEKAREPWETDGCEKELVPLKEAKGRICGEKVLVYPPGIPQILPGEIWGEEQISFLEKAVESHLKIYGLTHGNVRVLVSDGREDGNG